MKVTTALILLCGLLYGEACVCPMPMTTTATTATTTSTTTTTTTTSGNRKKRSTDGKTWFARQLIRIKLHLKNVPNLKLLREWRLTLVHMELMDFHGKKLKTVR